MHFLTFLHDQNVTQGQFFQAKLTTLNSEFSFSVTFCHTRVKEFSLPFYLPIVWERIVKFIPFPRVLRQCECKQPRAGFELGSLCLFATTVTIYHETNLTGISSTLPPFLFFHFKYLYIIPSFLSTIIMSFFLSFFLTTSLFFFFFERFIYFFLFFHSFLRATYLPFLF